MSILAIWKPSRFRAGCCLVCLLGALACHTTEENMYGETPMRDTVTAGSAQPPPEAVAIRPVTGPAVPSPAVPQAAGGLVRPYVNDARNARVPVGLPEAEGLWEVRWRMPLGGVAPRFVLVADGRIAVQGRSQWLLAAGDGTPLATHRLGASEVVLDPERALVYTAGPDGTLQVYDMEDGTLAYRMPFLFGSEFERVFIGRRGARLVVASVERKVDLHDPEPPEQALVELHDIGEGHVTDDLDFLMGAQYVRALERPVRTMQAAMQGDTVVIATPGRLEWADAGLGLQGRLEGDFEPHALSLDEQATMYLVVRLSSPNDPPGLHLWRVNREGERTAQVPLSDAVRDVRVPPIVGYDHSVYIAEGDSVRAIGADGAAAWVAFAGGPVAGAVALADHRLLASAGSVVASFTPEGERTIVFHAPEAAWQTPPIVTENGRILVASTDHLYCLQPAK